MQEKPTIPGIKARKGGEKVVCVTAYDAPTAAILDEAGVDIVLVGDSVGNVQLDVPDRIADQDYIDAGLVQNRRGGGVIGGDAYDFCCGLLSRVWWLPAYSNLHPAGPG